MAKRLVQSAGFLLLVLMASALYRNSVIVDIFPQEFHVLLKVTSNITSFINSIIALLIYAAIFYFGYSMAVTFDNPIPLSDYLHMVAYGLLYFCIVEQVKIIIMFLFLEGNLINLVPDATINIQLIGTTWYRYTLAADVLGMVGLPIFVYYLMRQMASVTKRQAVITAVAIFIGIAMFNAYQLLPDRS